MQKKQFFITKDLDIRKKRCIFARGCYLATLDKTTHIIN